MVPLTTTILQRLGSGAVLDVPALQVTGLIITSFTVVNGNILSKTNAGGIECLL